MNKLVYVGDNRNRVNWGCRGTSIALSQMLSSKFDISDIISGDYVSDIILIEETPFEDIFEFFQKVSNKFSIFNHLIKIKRKMSRYFDFIDEYPEQSLANLIKFKHKNQKLEFIYQSIESCDLVVINGEGDMIFTTPPRRKLLFLLMIIELANYLNKPVFYVNAMVSDDPEGNRNKKTVQASIKALEKCQLVALRDPESLEIVNSFKANINAQLVPDALFSWQGHFNENNLPKNGDVIIPFPETDEYFGKFDFSEPYICIGGTSLAPGNYEIAIETYLKLVNKIKTLEKKLYLVEGCAGDSYLKIVAEKSSIPFIPANVSILMAGSILANASLFISGRHHPSIFASLGGTPCIFLGSNSHKTRSLQKILQYDEVKEFSGFPTDRDVEQIFNLAKKMIIQDEQYQLRNSIKEVSIKRASEASHLIQLISDKCYLKNKIYTLV